jgi:hypothetical protein
LLYASAQTQYTALSPTGTHSTTWQITVRDASGQIAATPFYSGGDSGTSITADGMLVSSGSPVVLQPGTTYTLDFFVEVNGNCGGNAFLSAPTMSYISMPAS